MGLNVDLGPFIIDWLNENWNGVGLGFTPTFSTRPYRDDLVLPGINIVEFPARIDHMNVGSTYHMFYTRCAINVWDTDKARHWKMKREVRRIVFEEQKAPTTTTYPTPGIESILLYTERPILDPTRPGLLQQQMFVIVQFLETNP